MFRLTVINIFLWFLNSGLYVAPGYSSPFIVGVSLPLTGELAEYGVAAQNGMLLAINERPDDFLPIRFVFEDNRYDAKTAVGVFRKLKEQDQADIQFVWGDAPSFAVAPIAEKAKYPLLVMSTDPRLVKNTKYINRFINPYRKYTDAMLSYMRARKIAKIGVIQVDDPYYENLVTGLKSQLHENESVEVSSRVTFEEDDFKSAILKLRRAEYELIAVYLWPGQVSQFYRQAKSLRFVAATFGADVFESKSEIANAGGAMDGAIYVHNIVSPQFRARYFESFKNDFQIAYAANAYEFAHVMADIVQVIKTNPSVDAISDALRLYPGRDGAGGHMVFRQSEDGDRYFDFPVAVKRIVGSEIELVQIF